MSNLLFTLGVGAGFFLAVYQSRHRCRERQRVFQRLTDVFVGRGLPPVSWSRRWHPPLVHRSNHQHV
jgi:hypothetical protein